MHTLSPCSKTFTNVLSMTTTFIEAEAGPSTISNQNDSKVYKRLTQSSTNRKRLENDDEGKSDDVDDDELFDELERELEEEDERGSGMMGRLREERMEELRRQIRQEEANRNTPKGSGQVTEPSSEKELMSILADRGGEIGSGSGQPIIVHFYHKEFRRCDIMGTHLDSIAAQHPEALFLKISVLSSPFLVEKLGVKVLPCLVIFGRKVNVKDRIVGFEDLGNSDGFTTRTLEWRLAQGGALHEHQSEPDHQRAIGLGSYITQRSAADDDDLDWD